LAARTSKALQSLRSGLGAVDNVLSFSKSTAGKPSNGEKSLFVASVALSYAVWENYAEEVAIEVTTALARQIDEKSVPPTVQNAIMKSSPPPDAWQLLIHPGWRQLWIDGVRIRAQGDTGKAGKQQDFGMLTASARKVGTLFELVGVQPFEGVSASDLTMLDKLVEQRGQIVHKGTAPAKFFKQDAMDWRSFVERLAQEVDTAIASGAKSLTGKSPW